MTERLPTLSALEGPFSRVRFLMRHKVRVENEVFPTRVTYVESVSAVSARMLPEAGALAEALPTLVTSVRFLSSLRNLMSDQVRIKREASASLALVGLPFDQLSLKQEDRKSVV